MKVCVYNEVKGVAYTILLQSQIKKVVHSGKFEGLRTLSELLPYSFFGNDRENGMIRYSIIEYSS